MAESAEVVGSKGDHWYFREPVGLIRACVRATGDDPVIARAYTFDGSGYLLDVAGVGGRWVVLRRIYASRYAGCAWVEIEVVSPVTRARGREGALACDSPRMPIDGAPLVVTDRGVPAWIARDETGSRLVTTAPEATIELDTAGPGGLTGLTADGSFIRWVHDGEPRSAVLE